MQINELAELLGVSVSTLRHWEKELEVNVPRDELGQRTYPPAWVEYFRQVKALLDAGKKYADIKQDLAPPKPEPTEPPPPLVPPAELEELKQTVAGIQSDLKASLEKLAAFTGELKEFAGGLAQLQDGQTGTQEAVTGLQSGLQDIAADLKGCNKSLKQAQKSIEGLQDNQSGYSKEIAGLQQQISALQAAPGLPAEDLQALKTFKERFWVYMGVVIFLYMVLTIGVVQSIR